MLNKTKVSKTLELSSWNKGKQASLINHYYCSGFVSHWVPYIYSFVLDDAKLRKKLLEWSSIVDSFTWCNSLQANLVDQLWLNSKFDFQ